MKKVIDNQKMTIIEVPNDYIQCTVCGTYCHQDSYKNPDEDKQSRTNCKWCYELRIEDMEALSEKTKKRNNFFDMIQLKSKLLKMKDLFNYSMDAEEMIKELRKLPQGSKIFIGQEGYYAEGEFGDIHIPEKSQEIDNVSYYSIGHSSQNI